VLLRAADRSKDQSYVLYMLTSEQLRRTRFPVGDLEKTRVRALAAEAALPVAQREESQEICFVPSDDYRRLIRERAPEALRAGPIVDLGGAVLGEHRGLAGYTVGQRKRLGLAGGPWYVVALDTTRNVLVVGPEKALYASQITLAEVHLGPACPDGLFEVEVMTRYRGPETPAVVTPLPGNEAVVRFLRRHRAPAPGQAAVFYRGDLLLGGGTIVSTSLS
jgi:tRNA-specific 2-thiouridylase